MDVGIAIASEEESAPNKVEVDCLGTSNANLSPPNEAGSNAGGFDSDPSLKLIHP